MVEEREALRARPLRRADSNHLDAREDRSPERRCSIPDSAPEDVSCSRTPSASRGAEGGPVGGALRRPACLRRWQRAQQAYIDQASEVVRHASCQGTVTEQDADLDVSV